MPKRKCLKTTDPCCCGYVRGTQKLTERVSNGQSRINLTKKNKVLDFNPQYKVNINVSMLIHTHTHTQVNKYTGEKGHITHAEEFQIIYVDNPLSRSRITLYSSVSCA